LEENAVAWYMLMDNRISGLDLQSVPGFPFSRPYRDKLDMATRKEPSGESYNYFTSPSVLRSASRGPNIGFARSQNERIDINESLDIGEARRNVKTSTWRMCCLRRFIGSRDKIQIFIT